MLLRSVLVSLCLLPGSFAAADLVAVRCNGPRTGNVRVITDDGSACRGFSTAGKEYRFARFVSGTLLVSKDDRTIVLVEDYLLGSVEGSAIVATVDGERIVNPTVVQIWRDGKRVGMYDIARLVKDVRKVESTISHVRWVAQLSTSVDAQISLVTTSGRAITFDSKTGKLVDETDVPVPKRR